VTLEDGSYVYAGVEYKPEVTSVVLDDKTIESTDYTVSYSDNVNGGTGKVIVTGQRTYTGEAIATFNIEKAKVSITFNTPEVTIDMAQQTTYQQLPTVSISELPIEWSLSSQFVGSVDNSGIVTISAIGDVNVIASFEGNTNYAPASAEYLLKVEATYPLTIGNIVVNSKSRADILGNGTVIFDGNNKLMLSNANIKDVIETTINNLVVYIEGTSNIKGFKGNGGTLQFSTEGNNPGKLIMNNPGTSVIDGFSLVSFNQNLDFINGSTTTPETTIGVPIPPVISDDKPSQVIDLDGISPDGLDNKNVDDVLITTPSDPSQSLLEENAIVLSSVMVEEDVKNAKENYTPGTEEYAQEFYGLTFILPAGTGNIHLTVKTGAKGVLKVMIGDNQPVEIKGALDYQEFTIPYACEAATYVHIYNASEPDIVEAPSNRASKKTSVTVGIRTVGIAANSVQASNTMATSIRTVAQSENAGKELSTQTADVLVETGEESVSVADKEVAVLGENVFSNMLSDGFVGAIDLRNTSITGMTVSRSNGAFKGVSKNTFIFIPAGNYRGENEDNVVIGNICPKAMLDSDMPADESFSPSSAFTAQKISLSKTFRDNEVATVYLPFDMSFVQAAALGTFYTVGKIANGFVKIDEVKSGTLTAHTPYLFRANTNQISMNVVNVTLPPSSVRRGAPENSEDGLHGCYCRTTNTSGYRLTGTDISNLAFERMSSSDVIRPFEAYLALSDDSNPSLTVTDDESIITGIKDATRHQKVEDYNVYDIQGRKITSAPLSRGIYIRNGKKLIVE